RVMPAATCSCERNREIILPRSLISPSSVPRLPEIWPISLVLPAPLGPISAWTSPCATSSVTASVATRPPKRLVTPRSSSIALPRNQSGNALRREEHDHEQHHADAETCVLLVVGRERRE